VVPVAVTSVVGWFFPAAFLLIGGGMIALAVKTKRRRARWEAAAASTSGEVTDLRWQSVGQAGDSNLLAFPVLRFSLPAGGGASVVSGVIIALGGILIAVGLAAAAFLAVVR
jgi:hypothetical protein